MFMCRQHWYSLRRPLRDAVWREYRPGQEVDKEPSSRYMAVQRRAVAEVAANTPELDRAIAIDYLRRSEQWRRRAVRDGMGDPLAGLSGLRLPEVV